MEVSQTTYSVPGSRANCVNETESDAGAVAKTASLEAESSAVAEALAPMRWFGRNDGATTPSTSCQFATNVSGDSLATVAASSPGEEVTTTSGGNIVIWDVFHKHHI